MVGQIRKSGKGLFRIHDSGDLFSAEYARCWAEIARRLPGVRFRCPTREWATKSGRKLAAIRELAELPNVNVQPSALRIGDPAPEVAGLGAGTAVVRSFEGRPEIPCPTGVPGKAKSCHENGCYVCWDKGNARGIAYLKH